MGAATGQARTGTGHSRSGAPASVGFVLETNARRALRAVYRGGVGALRRAGVSRFAREMIDVETLLARSQAETVRVRRWTLEEPPRSLRMLPASDAVAPLRGVRTTISLLDITDPLFAIRNGYVIDGERRVVYERNVVPSFGSLRIALEPLDRPRRVHGTVAWLWNSSNYGHWLLYALSLVPYYRSWLGGDPDYFYVGSPVSSYQIESLGMLGISPERIIDDSVQADRLVAAIRDRAFDYDSELLLSAGHNLVPSADSAGPDDGRCLFVSRAGASHRRLVNETECAQALEDAFGVELISTDGMSLKDEIELFRSARLVVGGHGAGLTNLIFAPSATRVVELAPTTYWDSLFAQIAAVKRQPYALVRGRSTRMRMGVPPVWHNFEIDVQRLLTVVSTALDAPGP